MPLEDAQTSTVQLIPLWVKLAYSAFLVVLVPIYWYHYTPVNFLWFCDVALFLTLIAVWTEDPLPASMAAIGIMLPQMLWIFDIFDRALTGEHHLVDLTEYMFDAARPVYLRALSLFHGWLPLLLLWIVARLGYDRRAIIWQPVLTAVVLVLSFLLVSQPGHSAGNVNKVLGSNDSEVITSMPRWAWLCVLIVLHPLLIHLPTHLLFVRLFPEVRVAREVEQRGAAQVAGDSAGASPFGVASAEVAGPGKG
jgi:hypothetical protein